MSTRRRVGLLLAALVSATLTAAVGAPAAGASLLIPTPDHDAFYRPPANVASHADGAILRSRAVTAKTLGVPLPVNAWQVLYKSIDAHRKATAEVATVLVPKTPWAGPGRRPLVSYQTAEDSVGSQCSPSYALRGGLEAVTSNAYAETAIIALLVARGWAVVTSDYEGPHSDFLAGPQEGYAVLDGIRAALHFGPDRLGAQTPLGLWGYSGGAFATAWATQLQRRHAPELTPRAIAIGGTPAGLEASMRQIDGGYGFGLVFGALIGLDRAYPEKHLAGLLTSTGRAELARSSAACTTTLIVRYAFHSLRDYTTSTHPFDVPKLRDVLGANSPGRAVTSAPVYDYHATADELVPVAVDDALVAKYCAAGDRVQVVRDQGGSHNGEALTGAPGAINFLAARFARTAPVDNCR